MLGFHVFKKPDLFSILGTSYIMMTKFKDKYHMANPVVTGQKGQNLQQYGVSRLAIKVNPKSPEGYSLV